MNKSFLAAVFLLLFAVIANAAELILYMGHSGDSGRLLSPGVVASYFALAGALGIAILGPNDLSFERRVFIGSIALALISVVIGYSRTDLIGEMLMVVGLVLILVTLAMTMRIARFRRTKA